MGIVLKNNAHTLLSANISSTDTTIYVDDVSSFPSLGVGDYFYCTLESTSGTYEIIKVTQVNATSFVAVRGQEDTIAVPFNIGARVEQRITVQGLEDYFDQQVVEEVSDELAAAIGVTLQAYDAQLDDIAALTPTNTRYIVGNGTDFVLSASSVTTEAQAAIAAAVGVSVQAYSSELDIILGLGALQASPGDNIPYRWDFGVNAGTSYPSARIGGPSRGGFTGPFYVAADAGDTVDWASNSVDGTASSPTNWTNFCPHGTFYDWSPQVSQTKPVDNTTYIGRHSQIYYGQTQTPADGSLGGWLGIGVTENNDTVPWLDMWRTGASTGKPGWVWPGLSNKPDYEARETDGGTLITSPYTYPALKNIFSAGIVNPQDIAAQGVHHIIASDNSVGFAAIAIRHSNALTYGHNIEVDHGNDSLIIYPVVANSRGSNAIEFDNDGNILPLVDGGSDIGTTAKKMGIVYSRQFSATNPNNSVVGHLHAAHASFSGDVLQLQTVRAGNTGFNFLACVSDVSGTPVDAFKVDGMGNLTVAGAIQVGHATDTTLSRNAAGILQVEANPIVMRGNNETITGVKTFATSALAIVDSTFKATSDGTDCRWQFDSSDYLEYNRTNNRWRRVIGGSIVESMTATTWTSTTPLTVNSGTAIPAGGTAGAGYSFSSTSNFGVYFGSGAPSLSAAKGSLYLRSDGTGINDRAYINTNGTTTWTALVTVA